MALPLPCVLGLVQSSQHHSTLVVVLQRATFGLIPPVAGRYKKFAICGPEAGLDDNGKVLAEGGQQGYEVSAWDVLRVHG